MSETPEKPFLPDKPNVSRKFWIVLWVTCAVSILLEFLVDRDEHFKTVDSAFASATNGFGFYVALGFLACSGAILLAKGLGLFLKAREDYYDDTP
jgi:acyl dehydratase